MSGFDIHVDAQELNPEAEKFLVNELKLWKSDFCGHPEGHPSYEPPHHLTFKTDSSVEYKQVFRCLEEYFSARPDRMRGYLEGEFFAFDEDIQANPYNVDVSIPFRVKTAFLSFGKFRESEIHVTLNRDKTDPRLLSALTQMGLFSAYIAKSYGVGQVFTVQGTRAQIDILLPKLFTFLQQANGVANCSVKEERIVNWWMSEPNLPLPPVAGHIELF